MFYSTPAGEPGNQASQVTLKQGLSQISSLISDNRNGAFNPGAYDEVGRRLAALQNYNIPFLGNDVQAAQAGGDGPQVAVYGPTAYSLPVDNLRTKQDLVDLDRITEQMQATVYEHPSLVAAAGTGQPGAHYTAAIGVRKSNTPPKTHLPSSHNAGTAATPQSNHSGTPALTPPSDSVSNTSGGSPSMLHADGNGLSPTSPGPIYPTLPTTTSSNGYSSSGIATTSTLSNQYDHDQRRRYSGGRLQKAQPMYHNEDVIDTSDNGPATPNNVAVSSSSSEAGTIHNVGNARRKIDIPNANIDPALGGDIASPSGEMDEGTIRANETWVENARTIEALRAWISARLENQEYESDDDKDVDVDEDVEDDDDGLGQKLKREVGGSLYPVLHS